ncbi:MAG: glycine zipper 2TM domain-containing protein [Gammaproteobacteria bacterium PRO9]|nr:glycine zipper 2TM domain-containing protein [Gammaproteobacteria bacterium PRO9]
MTAIHDTDSSLNQGTRRSPRYLLLLAAVLLPACATAPPRHAVRHERIVPAEPVSVVYVYPAAGQSPAQLDRDRYGCHLWAVQQSRFDPSAAGPAPRQEVVAAGPPAGTSTVAGAATGAVLGAVVARPGNAGKGAVIGAVAGGLLGAAADSARQQEIDRYNEALERRSSRRENAWQREAGNYRRALSACLVGRGYSVK